MNRHASAASALSAAIGLALGLQLAPVSAQEMGKGTGKDAGTAAHAAKDMGGTSSDKLEKCYGINAVSKNDCGEGSHSCAGQATQARDPKSFVLLPAGACNKIAGGKLKAS
jgi:uncharacterized membrane protein